MLDGVAATGAAAREGAGVAAGGSKRTCGNAPRAARANNPCTRAASSRTAAHFGALAQMKLDELLVRPVEQAVEVVEDQGLDSVHSGS